MEHTLINMITVVISITVLPASPKKDIFTRVTTHVGFLRCRKHFNISVVMMGGGGVTKGYLLVSMTV